MVDSGSTLSVCRPSLAKSDSTTGNIFTILVRGHGAATQAPEIYFQAQSRMLLSMYM